MVDSDPRATSGLPFRSPDLVHRSATGAPLAAGDRSTFYSGGDHGYIDYPALPADAPPASKGYWLVLSRVTDPARARGEVATVVEGSVARRPCP